MPRRARRSAQTLGGTEMYSPWHSALLSGTVAALAIAASIALQIVGSTTPESLPVALAVSASAVAALVAGIFVSAAVRSGLLLARCQQLPVRFALITAVVNVAVLGVLGAAPVETQAIKLDMPSAQSTPVAIPHTFWLLLIGMFLVPVVVAYFAGRMARGRASAA